VKRNRPALGLEFLVIPERRIAGGECLPTAFLAACAEEARWIERSVAEFSSHSVMAGDQLSVGEYSSTDALRDGQEHYIADSVDPPEGQLRQQACGGGISICTGKRIFFQSLFQVEVGPVEVGREDQPLGVRIDSAGEADANPFNGFVEQTALHPNHAVNDAAGGPGRVEVE